MSGYGMLWTLVICLGQLLTSKVHILLINLQSTWFLSSYTGKIFIAFYFKFGTKSLKWSVMGASTLLYAIMSGKGVHAKGNPTWQLPTTLAHSTLTMKFVQAITYKPNSSQPHQHHCIFMVLVPTQPCGRTHPKCGRQLQLSTPHHPFQIPPMGM